MYVLVLFEFEYSLLSSDLQCLCINGSKLLKGTNLQFTFCEEETYWTTVYMVHVHREY